MNFIREYSPLFFRTAWLLCRREFFADLRSPWVFVAGTVAAVVEAQFLVGPANLLRDVGLVVSQNLMIPAFLGAIFVAAIFASIISATSLVSEREKQTLMVLFFTPVDHASLILGKFLAQLLSSLIIVLTSLFMIVLYSLIARFPLSTQFVWASLLCVLLISNMVAFSLTISAISKSTRGAILILVVTMALLFGLQILKSAVDQLLPLMRTGQFNYVLPILDLLYQFAAVFSPLAFLFRGLESISLSSSRGYIINLSESLLYSGVFLMVAVALMRRRGVYK